MNALTLRLSKLWIFFDVEFQRDTRNLSGFCVKYFWIFMLCFIYSFFFRSALWQKNIFLEGHPIDFPLFLVSGLTAVRVLPLSTRIFDETLLSLKNAHLDQWAQTTPTSVWELFTARALWSLTRVLTELLAMVLFARMLIGIPLRPFFQAPVIGAVLLLFAAQAGVGLILSSVALLLRKESVLHNFFFQISVAFGGVFFPAEMLRGRLEALSFMSDLLPITHALHVMRRHLINEGAQAAGNHEQTLMVLALFYILTGFVVLRQALLWGKKSGHFG